MRFRPSLYLRLILALLAPLLLAMAAAWAIGVGIITDALEQRLEGQLRNAAAVMVTAGIPYTPELLRRLASIQQADFVLLDRAGRVIAATSGEVGDAVAASLARRGPWPDSEIRRLGVPVQSIAVYKTVDSSHEPQYAALVAVASLSDAGAAATRAARWLGLAMLAATAVLGVVVLTLVRNITRPLKLLSQFADRIAAGERQHKLELPRDDEIGALGESLNSMMHRLAGYESRLASRSRISALGELSARLAHEIRNPLTGLKLHLQLLAERVDAQAAARVAQLLSEVERMELLVSSTLLLRGEKPLEAAPTPVGSLVRDVLGLMEPSLTHRGIRSDSAIAEGVQANVDPARLRQALLNLVVNAADAMPQGGRLRVGAECAAGASRVHVFVEDSGPGVSDEMRRRLFDAPFSTKPFGLGLGLAICRDVAAAHGGELLIERSPELGGARFVIALPLATMPTAVDSHT